jgi:hypothetical protein
MINKLIQSFYTIAKIAHVKVCYDKVLYYQTVMIIVFMLSSNFVL